MTKEDNIIVPRWFLEVVEDTLRIQNNINIDKETEETCQDRNIRQSLNGVRKLLSGEELTGMERLEKLQPPLPSNLDEVAKKIAYDVCKALPNGEEKDTVLYYAILAALAAAKWIAEQGETKEGLVVDNNDFIDFGDNSFIDVCPTLDKKAFNLHDGEKVIVQIRRKEE